MTEEAEATGWGLCPAGVGYDLLTRPELLEASPGPSSGASGTDEKEPPLLVKLSITEDKTIWAGLNHPELPLEEADIAVFGIPYDGGVSFRSGTCEAPQELRKITHTISPTTEDFRDISSVKVKDLGDCVGKDRDEMFAEAEELAYQAVKAGKFFTMIGGDHSVTIPVHRGVNRAVEEDFGIIHIDAHFDLCHEMHGDILSHGSTERRATELSHVGDSDHLYFLGIRSIESDELEFYQNNKINVLSAADVDHLGVPAALERMVSHMKRFSKVYITLDIDCLDPAYAAGTGTPQFGGLTARQLLDLLKGLFDGLNIIGMDVVEVAPRLDPSLAALFAARKIITECWAHHYFKNLARA
ncbi:MAG: agmatinase [Flavonifractor plautii]